MSSSTALLAALATTCALLAAGAHPVAAGGASPTPTPSPSQIVLAGDFQQQVGCANNWDPTCTDSQMVASGTNFVYPVPATVAAGNYQAKVTFDGSWNNAVPYSNYLFTVPDLTNPAVSFEVIYTPDGQGVSSQTSLNSPCNGQPGAIDNCLSLSALLHDSRNDLFRFPQGAVPANSTVRLRLATAANDATGVVLHTYATSLSVNSYVDAVKVGSFDGSDYWEATVPAATTSLSGTVWYDFFVSDGSYKVSYRDDAQFPGGVGQVTDPSVWQNSYAITVYEPSFVPLPHIEDTVAYQIFPDRFRNGDRSNDVKPGYDAHFDWKGTANNVCTTNPDGSNTCGNVDNAYTLHANWTDFPVNYCSSYDASNIDQSCAGPYNNDFFGGDLEGIRQKLVYLRSLGVNTLYLNPIFNATSNHMYDTADWTSVSKFFGDSDVLKNLLRDADDAGIKVILDAVFTDSSSDSPFFNRYGNYDTVGACQNLSSPYRSWYTFLASSDTTAPCVGDSTVRAYYDGWSDYDTLPLLTKSLQVIQNMFFGTSNSIAERWLNFGASGWRLDAMNDNSYPAGFWEGFRKAVKALNPNAVIIGEVWDRLSNLQYSTGTTNDGTMNYRFHDAINTLLAAYSSNTDVEGFANIIQSIREDYPDAYYYTSWNLLGSHDTDRILWRLTPGNESRADRELNAANVLLGKRLTSIARTIQFTVPGSPIVYYGDEVSVSGYLDPDCRRTFPWNDLEHQVNSWPFGAGGDLSALEETRALIAMRRRFPAFRRGKLSFVYQNETEQIVAYTLRTEKQAALVIVNVGSNAKQSLSLSFDSTLLPNKVNFFQPLNLTAHRVTAFNHSLVVPIVQPNSTLVFVATEDEFGQDQDLQAPEETIASIQATAGNANVTVTVSVPLAIQWEDPRVAHQIALFRAPLPGAPATLIATFAPKSKVHVVDVTEIHTVNVADVVRVTKTITARGNSDHDDLNTYATVVSAPSNVTLYYSAAIVDHAGNIGQISQPVAATAL